MSIDIDPIRFERESPQIGIDPFRRLAPTILPRLVEVDRAFIDTQAALRHVETPRQREAIGGIIGNLTPVLSQRLKADGLDVLGRYSLQRYMPTEAVDRFEQGSLLPVAQHMGDFTEAFSDKDPKVAANVLEALVARAVMSVNARSDAFDVQAIVRELIAAQATLDRLKADSSLQAELVDVDTGDHFPSIGVKVQKRDGKSRALTILPVPILDHGDGVVAYKDPEVESRPNSRFMREGKSVLLGVGFKEGIRLSEDNLAGLSREIKPLLTKPRKKLWLTSGLTVMEITEDEEIEQEQSSSEVSRTLGAIAASDQLIRRQDEPPIIVPAQSVGPYWAKGRMGDIDAIIPQAEVTKVEGAMLRAMMDIQEQAKKLGVPVDPTKVASAAKIRVLGEEAKQKGRNTTL